MRTLAPPLCNIHIDTLVLDMYIHPRHIRYEYVKKKSTMKGFLFDSLVSI